MRLLLYEGKCNICGERVRIAREDRGLSQEELAAKIQLNGHSLTQKATGQRVVADYEIPLLADALKVDHLWLLKIIDAEGNLHDGK